MVPRLVVDIFGFLDAQMLVKKMKKGMEVKKRELAKGKTWDGLCGHAYIGYSNLGPLFNLQKLNTKIKFP